MKGRGQGKPPLSCRLLTHPTVINEKLDMREAATKHTPALPRSSALGTEA